MKLVVGLGNPGPRYAGNRHNVGFMAVAALARRHGIGPFRRKFQAQVADGQIAGARLLLLAPETFMNASGQAVGEAARFHKIAPEDIIVLHDELDLAPGKIKVKQGGGAGGHNGIRDIEAHLGPAFWRVRLGIGHPGHKDRVLTYVLGDFAKAEEDWLAPMLDAVADHFALMLEGRPADFMSKVAAQTRPAEKAKPLATAKPKEGEARTSGGSVAEVGAPPPSPTGLAAALAEALDRKSQKGNG
ncbi:aminoacyl-tRNA hydrolase [Rhodospirillum rubrum]|uniref:Peptidyl-tRNA hydrolase n=1 Tax=Rhodospirillum rubrum (strain ATCC 11170 / ATH 1.1.1 / DSM 467 / LMG 4362 / NCIMB 8255 / S1) TaxID=269796 RepID=PTH_RHORT|nr:aminoacyl-tRNA hydrolase [Rhodospirillum rubrum]Q2RMV4.1 RecName: Full=Peptidyl-tRNA hydrolase; Short=PTH [Rhodospirillum rubrum ATCC 11170]ABC24541.1 peptidyl-tRNA hydrolase [Rhodospirillum rubrum ATCC 11170]AEO50294.1 peptidyl-tRNA hydrolase [Rhodospirillum rubrum F11]MBK5956266.1 peptidyl-tRNA hydrolase [Rhodospirillum rubrum]QXG80457.1 aminoacyl-tRNA hydrolase [Rhodospirillum rubrum]HAQ00970.1 peptidyl-tRNA hydrolase [Rhodospirillum rubrum]